VRFTDFTFEELRDLTPKVRAVFIPLGCTEQQGPHMTVDFDSLMITRLCEEIAQRLEAVHDVLVLVMPTLPFGPTPEHSGFGHGYVNLRQSTHEALVEDILESLSAQGFRRLLLWRGCGQHELGSVVDRFNTAHGDSKVHQPVLDYGAISNPALGIVPGGHADSFATSVCMVLDQSRIRSERIRLAVNRPLDWTKPVDFAATSDTGVIGDPTKASLQAGRQIWQQCVEAGTQAVIDILSTRPVREAWRFKEL
jgi:creatinine amidohydrolase